MSHRPLGSSGLSVAPIGLGGMPLSIDGRPSEAEGVKVVHAALDAGMTLIDTADVYCLGGDDIGHNERLIAKALKEYKGERDGIVVATKAGCTRPGKDWANWDAQIGADSRAGKLDFLIDETRREKTNKNLRDL